MPKGFSDYKSIICSKCKIEIIRPNQRYCRQCHNKYMQEWRKTHPLSEEQRFRSIVRSKTKMRVRRGLLIKCPCEVCGNKEVQAHHKDYSKPYDITWLCKSHHQELHNNLRKEQKHV